MFTGKKSCILVIAFFALCQTLYASKLVELKVLDQNHLMLHFKDAEVNYVDDGTGAGAFGGHHSGEAGNSYVVSFGEPLDLSRVSNTNAWKIISIQDANYGISGIAPAAVHRKSKVNGMSYTGWDPISSDHGFDYTKEHFIYLQLPFSMQQNKTYTIEIDKKTRSDSNRVGLSYDIFNCPSEAVHTNLVGYMSSSRIKAADLYHFMGDGGYRDYTDFIGNSVYIYNVNTEESQPAGSVAFWMENRRETNHNLTGSDVWSIDFSGFNEPGTYRLAVEGVGCSRDFEIRNDVYYQPYKTSIRGYFYMRIGQDNPDMTPVPRRPLFIPNQNPPGCTVYITDMDPYHPQWNTFAAGDKWDKPQNWAFFKKNGSPTNAAAVGGHSDALDWDRHLGHVVNVYDLCLAYLVSNGALDDDDLGIAESGNGIPDILDEARNEVDFWLNLRYQGGYSHGLTNPDDNNNLYQADNTAMAACANALNSAMLACCFQLAGLNGLKSSYEDSARIAYTFADNMSDPMLQTKVEGIRVKDFKMMAAAFLYNLSGDRQYEEVMQRECVVNSATASIYQQGAYNQLWGVAAYLLTKQPVHYPNLHANMKAAVIAKARHKEAGKVHERPSRRGYSDEQSWWQTNQDMPRTVLAHAVSDNPAERLLFLDALVLEADWGLGRNPLNMIQMTTATTGLADKRSIENCYTSGRDDGTPGLHPGHTPYLNVDSWGGHMVGNNPQKIFELFYPDISQWPHASKYINSRHIWAHSEFTPRQTMRGKTLLYAYLYALSKNSSINMPLLVADAGPDQRIVDNNEDGKETINLNGAASYSSHDHITSYEWILNGRQIAGGETATVELDTGRYEIILTIKDSLGESAVDTVAIEILPSPAAEKPDYGFETGAEFDDWMVENFGNYGGNPIAVHSNEIAHGGEFAYKIRANFLAGSEHALRRDAALPQGITSLLYHIWIPQVLVDSAFAVHQRNSKAAGGIQNYLMHNGWQWVSEWFSLQDLDGNDWNKIELKIPEYVDNGLIQAIGLSIKTEEVNAGKTSVYIDDIYFREKSQTAVDGRSFYLAAIPRAFRLYNNYPNPFNPETIISYNIAKPGPVKMTVYDIAGRRIEMLVDERHKTGSYQVVFDGSELASGIYLYTLETPEYKAMKKMTLLK